MAGQKEAQLHKVFVSYYHYSDQPYKDSLVTWGEQYGIFIDQSVDTDDISDDLSDQYIREIIRDGYLRDSTVTIVLVGTETKRRKHVDWEIYSSMYDGKINKKSGIVVINLPETGSEFVYAPHGDAEKGIYPDLTSWTSIGSRTEYESLCSYMPARLVDNLVKPDAKVSVTPWRRINTKTLPVLIELAFRDRGQCQYDLSQPMRRNNS